jgi:hypothetical protein
MVVDHIESSWRSIPTTLVKDMPFTLEMTCLEKTSVSRALCIGNTMIVSRGLKPPWPLSSDVAYSIIFITSIYLFHLVSPPSATTTTWSLGQYGWKRFDRWYMGRTIMPLLSHAMILLARLIVGVGSVIVVSHEKNILGEYGHAHDAR